MKNPIHVIHGLTVAQPTPPAHTGYEVRSATHGLCATGYGNPKIAEQDALRGGNDCLQAGATQAVNVEGWRFQGNTSSDRRYPGQVGVLWRGWNDIAHHHVTNLLAVDARVADGTFDSGGSQITQGNIL